MTAPDLCTRFDKIMTRLHEAEKNAGRPFGSVQLVAASKGHLAPHVATLARHWGQHATPVFGESYAQEALAKQTDIAALLQSETPPSSPFFLPEWHFMGHIQSRKAKEIAGQFTLIHSVASLKVAQNLHKEWEQRALGQPSGLQSPPAAPQRILVQVNIGNEPQKSGVAPSELEALCTGILALPGLALEGLMCLPPVVEHAHEARPFFAALRTLREQMQTHTGLALPHLSMGMSDDFEEAIMEGATMVRIGTDIFGRRQA